MYQGQYPNMQRYPGSMNIPRKSIIQHRTGIYKNINIF